MTLLSVKDVCLKYGGSPLLDHINFQLEKGERVCLLGRNGTGKSSLLGVLAGETEPDAGELSRRQGVTVGVLTQEVPTKLQGTVAEVVAEPLIAREPDPWLRQQRIEPWLSKMELLPEAETATLSAGQKRRVLLARAVAAEPDILLLDEPTNHLDIPSISWLEGFLQRYGGALVFVTHDREFVRALATRIIEIDRGRIHDWSCDYKTFINRRDAALAAEQVRDAVFDKKLAQEEEWIRKGIKARRTRNEGRVRSLQKMRKERSDRRQRLGSVKMQTNEVQKSGKLVIEARGLSFTYNDKAIITDFSTTIMRGDRIGVIGPNGSGKTTLLKVLLGQLSPQAGSIREGTNLQTVYYDQLRDQLDSEKSVRDNVADGNDKIWYGGRTRHVIGYLKDFLFSPERANMPVKALSGGERNRLLLARMFTRPANVLILDEPTNDLDIETLELLEELLLDFPGTLLLVSHDRTFLDNVVTSSLVFEGEGQVTEYVGGYADWQRQRQDAGIGTTKTASANAEHGKSTIKGNKVKSRSVVDKPRRLTFKEKRELETLPARIEELDQEQAKLEATFSDPDFYSGDGQQIAATKARFSELEVELAALYQRWEELEQVDPQ